MSAIVKEVYDAFLDAGASEEKATDAAKAIAGYDHSYDARFEVKLISDLTRLTPG